MSWPTTVGARPSDSSSMRSSFGSGMSAWLMASICCSPPERLPASWSMRSARRGNSVEHPLLGLARPRRVSLRLIQQARRRLSRTVSVGNTLRPPGIITTPPVGDLVGAAGRVMSSPAKVTVPAVGGEQAGDALEQRRLAGAVGAEEGDDLALVDVEVEPEQDLHRARSDASRPRTARNGSRPSGRRHDSAPAMTLVSSSAWSSSSASGSSSATRWSATRLGTSEAAAVGHPAQVAVAHALHELPEAAGQEVEDQQQAGAGEAEPQDRRRPRRESCLASTKSRSRKKTTPEMAPAIEPSPPITA